MMYRLSLDHELKLRPYCYPTASLTEINGDGLHGTATLLPDGSVFFAGENREALVRNDDPNSPLIASWAPDGVLKQGDPDQGVPVGQIFFPPYLFTSGGGMAARPAILASPKVISFRGHFDVKVAGHSDQIGSVVILRSDHNTHSLTAGDRYVKLAPLRSAASGGCSRDGLHHRVGGVN